MAGKSILRLGPIVAAALAAVSVIGCSKSVHKDKGQKTFDKDLVGYWAPAPKEGTSPEQASDAEDDSDVPPVVRIDSNGDLFQFNGDTDEFQKFGVVQADGAVLLTPEVLKSNESGPISVVLAKIDINSIKAVETGPESSWSNSGEPPVGSQKKVEKEFYYKRFTPGQLDEFKAALAARTQAMNPKNTGTVDGPSSATAAPGAFDMDFVGYWVVVNPYEAPYEILSGSEISDEAPLFRIDQNGQFFVYESSVDAHHGIKPLSGEDKSIGVVQKNGEIFLKPEFSWTNSVGLMVLIKDDSGEIQIRFVKSQLDSNGAKTGRLDNEFQVQPLKRLSEDQFNKAVEKRTKKSAVGGETAEEPAEVVAVDEEDSQVESAGNEELEPPPRIPTTEWIEIDPKTWEARVAMPDFVFLR
ncbi:MAG: hypothetical protein IPJ71_06110 [Bdellovibrionales bacterium]|jgi:hypothetical protein|nr:hypothetical protein [Bdellovibrionales bacterium]